MELIYTAMDMKKVFIYSNDNFIKKSFVKSPKEIVYVYGISSSYNLNNKMDINFNITKRKSNTDYWDSHDNNV